MTADDFKNLAARLTGTPVKGETDDAVLNQILSNEHREIDCSQFNELLLLVNKDRLERPFFEKFFGGKCAIADIANGVKRFQATAMLRYGNFIFAYRTLAKLPVPDKLADELGDLLNEDCEQTQDFKLRSDRVLEVTPIARTDTPLVGYLSPKQLVADAEQGRLLLTAASQIGTSATWDDLKSKVETATKPELHRPSLQLWRSTATSTQTPRLAIFTVICRIGYVRLKEGETTSTRSRSVVRETRMST